MTPPPLFFDLDGPLLDVRARYHRVYSAIAAELGVPALGLNEYWSAKRRRDPLRSFFPNVVDAEGLRQFYLDRWLSCIEAPEWLSRDTLVPGALECLDALARSRSLYLVTLRREPAALTAQLEALGLRRYFPEVFSGWAEGAAASQLKASWMRPLVLDGSGVMVGDTEVDMQAAAALRMCAIGVSFGIREPSDLMRLGAETVISNLLELPPLLERSVSERGAAWGLLSRGQERTGCKA
jgi:phosphoglycolate phosphatase